MDEEDVKKAVAAAVAPYQEEIKILRTELTEWKTKFSTEETARIKAESETKVLKQKDSEREAEVTKAKVKMAREAVTTMLEDAVKAKQITPAQREIAHEMFGVGDDARVVVIDLEKVKKYFSITDDNKGKKNFSDTSTAVGGGGGNEDGDPNRVHKDVFLEVDRRTKAAMSQNATLDYGKAMRHVFTSDPELHREYLTTDTAKELPKAAGGN